MYTICAQTINLKLSSQLAKLLRLFVWSFLKPDKSVASAEKVGNCCRAEGVGREVHIIDCGIGKKSACCLSCASSAAVVVDNCQPVTWNRKSFRSFALMRHRTKSSRAQWDRIMSQQPAEGRSDCRNFLIKILQSALSRRGREAGRKSTEIEEGLRRFLSLQYNNECLIARRPCVQVQPRLARNENVKTESNANEQQKIFPFCSHFRIFPSLLYGNLLKLTFLRAITIAIMCLRLWSHPAGLMRLCFLSTKWQVADHCCLSLSVCL